jgi:zinc/manganese transport system substrate-binding protein
MKIIIKKVPAHLADRPRRLRRWNGLDSMHSINPPRDRSARSWAPPRAATAAAVLSASALGLSACGQGAADIQSDHEITVVTSTSVYGDVAEQVAGDDVEVIPIIDSPAQDPHSFEAAPADRLTVEDADLVVVNGGGYDAFMEDLLGDSEVPVIDAVELSGLEGAEAAAEQEHDHAEGEDHDHDHSGFNEHVWYDLGTVDAVAQATADRLGELDPDGAQDYSQRSEDFGDELEALGQRLDDLDAQGDYLATEPVADHLLERAGLHDATPEEFTAAVEDGADIPPLTYTEVEETVDEGRLALFAYNEHTAGGQTERLREAADTAGVPVVSFTETMPEGESYLAWMSANIGSIEQAA